MKLRLLLVTAVLTLAAPAAAWGHATVTETSPSQGTALKSQPKQVVFRFSEGVETRFGAVRVFDRAGRRVDTGGTTQPNGSSAATKLKPGLGDGPYTATYQVVSADSHPIAGGYTFTVGPSGGQSAAAVTSLLDREQGPGPVADTGFAVAKGGAGHYTIPAATFAPAGDLRVEVSALISEFDQFTTRVEVPIR